MGTLAQSNPGSGPFHLAALWESEVAPRVKWSGSTMLLNGARRVRAEMALKRSQAFALQFNS